jgi:transcriptional/translational regulatory protein YebC/TACO1
VVTPPYEFSHIKEVLEKAGLVAEFAEVSMKPSTDTELSGDEAITMQKLLDALENLDDVQAVYTTAMIID